MGLKIPGPRLNLWVERALEVSTYCHPVLRRIGPPGSSSQRQVFSKKLRMPSRNSQQCQSWTFRSTPPLLPVPQRVNADSQCLGERLLAQPHKAAQGGD